MKVNDVVVEENAIVAAVDPVATHQLFVPNRVASSVHLLMETVVIYLSIRSLPTNAKSVSPL
jgi:hypothetical protein